MKQIYKKDNAKESQLIEYQDIALASITKDQDDSRLIINDLELTNYNQDQFDDILLKIREIYNFYNLTIKKDVDY